MSAARESSGPDPTRQAEITGVQPPRGLPPWGRVQLTRLVADPAFAIARASPALASAMWQIMAWNWTNGPVSVDTMAAAGIDQAAVDRLTALGLLVEGWLPWMRWTREDAQAYSQTQADTARKKRVSRRSAKAKPRHSHGTAQEQDQEEKQNQEEKRDPIHAPAAPVPKPKTPYQEAVAYHAEKYRASFVEGYLFSGEKDGAIVKRLLATAGSLEALKAKVDRAFADPWCREHGCTWGIISSKWSSLVSVAHAHTNGRHDPRPDLKSPYKRPPPLYGS